MKLPPWCHDLSKNNKREIFFFEKKKQILSVKRNTVRMQIWKKLCEILITNNGWIVRAMILVDSTKDEQVHVSELKLKWNVWISIHTTLITKMWLYSMVKTFSIFNYFSGRVVRVSRRKQMIFDKSNKKTFRQIINIDFKLAAFVHWWRSLIWVSEHLLLVFDAVLFV